MGEEYQMKHLEDCCMLESLALGVDNLFSCVVKLTGLMSAALL